MKRIIWGREKRYRTAVFSRRIAGHSTEFTHQEAARWVREKMEKVGAESLLTKPFGCELNESVIYRLGAATLQWVLGQHGCPPFHSFDSLSDCSAKCWQTGHQMNESKTSTYDSVWDSMTFHLNYCIHSHFSRISEDSVSHVNRLMAYKGCNFPQFTTTIELNQLISQWDLKVDSSLTLKLTLHFILHSSMLSKHQSNTHSIQRNSYGAVVFKQGAFRGLHYPEMITNGRRVNSSVTRLWMNGWGPPKTWSWIDWRGCQIFRGAWPLKVWKPEW